MNKKTPQALVVVGALSLPLAALAQDQTLLVETFSYASGAITAVSGGIWNAHNGAGTNPVQVGATGVAVLRGGSAEDVNATLSASPLTAGTLFASFTLDLSSATIAASGVSTYLVHFKDTSTGFRGRVFIGSATVADPDLFRIGVENDGSDGAATVAFTSNLDRTAPYQVTLAYDLSAGTSKLWVNAPVSGPATVEDNVAAAPVGIVGVALRQGGSGTSTGNFSGAQVDNLTVTYSPAAVPEPGTWALGLVGAGILGWSARRRGVARL